MEDIIISVAQRTLVAGTPLLLGTIGEIICERSGILNLGVEGVMSIGAVTAFIVTFYTNSPWLGLYAAVLAGMVISLVHAFASITLQSNQVVSGLALTMLGLGISGLVGKPYVGKPLAVKMQTFPIPVLSDIPFAGPIFFNQSPFLYMAIFLAVAAWFTLEHTRIGIKIRSTGENPKATEAQGVHVSLIRYACVLAGGAFSGMAGAHLSVSYSKSWIEGMDRHRSDHFCALESHAGHDRCLFVRLYFRASVSAAAVGYFAQFSGHAALFDDTDGAADHWPGGPTKTECSRHAGRAL